jgi:hypothetical protein
MATEKGDTRTPLSVMTRISELAVEVEVDDLDAGFARELDGLVHVGRRGGDV